MAQYYYKYVDNVTVYVTLCIEAVHPSGGQCIITQIHLERTPSAYAIDLETLSQLTSTEYNRISCVRQLLKQLEIRGGDCDLASSTESVVQTTTPCHLLFTSNEVSDVLILTKIRNYVQ